MTLLPRPSTTTGAVSRSPTESSVSLAVRHECASDANCQLVELVPLALEPRAHRMGERQIHVVAAEEDVIADGDALERQVAVALG